MSIPMMAMASSSSSSNNLDIPVHLLLRVSNPRLLYQTRACAVGELECLRGEISLTLRAQYRPAAAVAMRTRTFGEASGQGDAEQTDQGVKEDTRKNAVLLVELIGKVMDLSERQLAACRCRHTSQITREFVATSSKVEIDVQLLLQPHKPTYTHPFELLLDGAWPSSLRSWNLQVEYVVRARLVRPDNLDLLLSNIDERRVSLIDTINLDADPTNENPASGSLTLHPLRWLVPWSRRFSRPALCVSLQRRGYMHLERIDLCLAVTRSTGLCIPSTPPYRCEVQLVQKVTWRGKYPRQRVVASHTMYELNCERVSQRTSILCTGLVVPVATPPSASYSDLDLTIKYEIRTVVHVSSRRYKVEVNVPVVIGSLQPPDSEEEEEEPAGEDVPF